MIVYRAVGFNPADAPILKKGRQQFQAKLLPIEAGIHMIAHR